MAFSRLILGMDPRRFLAALRHRLIRAVLVEGSARTFAVLVVTGVAAIGADWLWRLPGGVRLALLATVILVTAAVAWVRILRPLRHNFSDAALARFAERRVPQISGRLLTWIDGIALGQVDDAALAATLAAVDLRVLVPARRTPKQLAFAGAALLTVVGAIWWSPQVMSDGAARLLLPLGERAWRVHTQLQITLQQPVVPADGALIAMIERTHPDAGYSAPVIVSWRGARISDLRQLGGLTGTSWSTSIAAPPGVYEITVTSGDALPATVTGRIVARPVLGSVQATVTPPTYTGLPTQRLATLATSVVPGTTLAFAVDFTTEPGRQIATASARFAGENIGLQAVDGRWIGSFVPKIGGSLELFAADQDQIKLAGEVRFPISVTPDRVPVVSLTGVVPRETVTVRAVLGLTVAASDDFGLGAVALHAFTNRADKAAGPEVSAPGEALARFTGVGGQTAVTRQADIEVGRHAGEGDTVVFTGRATDRNDVTGPGIGDSEQLMVKVVAEDILRQEFDRLLGEARDRVVQSREDLATAVTTPAEAPRRLRSAAQTAGKADELLAQVLRRWAQNRFAPEAILPGQQAHTVLAERAMPQLAATTGADATRAETARLAADQALADAERLLGSILQEGDLTRLLTSLIARQTALNTESKAFARAFLLKPLDAAGKALQANLATRQRDLADLVMDVERRLLAKEGSAWTRAQDLVRKQAPGDRLRQAGQDLATADRRNKAIDDQQTALTALQQLLDALRGGDAAKDLAAELGKLAAEQEQLAKELEQGVPPGALTARQKDLAERTQAAQSAAQAKDPDGAKLLASANAAQQSGEKAMRAGDAGAATRDANAAAGMLREAQKHFSGDTPKKPEDEQKKEPDKQDILALLKELRTLQAAVVTDATLLDQSLGAKHELPPDFASARQVQAIAKVQGDLRLRLTEEALKRLDANPIAKLAVERVEVAMHTAETHLATPLLGSKGVRLTRAALAEIGRLLDVAENLPKPEQKPDQGGGQGSSQAPAAAFPPQAELALLAAMQAEIAQRTAAGAPTDLAANQERLQHLVESLAQGSRPDSRPAVLLERTRRAMTSAAFQLNQRDRGALTRHEQQAAEAALRRLLAEAGGGGGGGGGKNKPPPPRAGDGSQPPPNGGDGQGQAAGDPTAVPPGDPKADGKNPLTAVPVQANTVEGDLLQLPPAIRDQLLQAREQQFTPGQMQVYQRYLELLEEGK